MTIITLRGQLPTANLNQAVSFVDWLTPGDSIVSATVTADPGITIGSSPPPTVSGAEVIFWVTGGTLGATYIITVTITTAMGEVFPQQCRIAIGTPSVSSFNAPSLDNYLAWLRSQGFTDAALPGDSMFISLTYDAALAIVNEYLAVGNPMIYTLAVYNLGADMLVNWAPDEAGSTYFATLRASYGTFAFAPGVVTSSSDGGTSTSIANPDSMKEFTLANLQNLKTPYGRQYLAFAQSFGQLWGLT